MQCVWWVQCSTCSAVRCVRAACGAVRCVQRGRVHLVHLVHDVQRVTFSVCGGARVLQCAVVAWGRG